LDGAASLVSATLGGEQSKQTKVVLPSSLLKEPWLLDLWMPHLMQLMVSPVLPSVPKGEPPVLDLYLNPSLEILVLSSRGMFFSASQFVFDGVSNAISSYRHQIIQGFEAKCLK
jgi:hypothetical protein